MKKVWALVIIIPILIGIIIGVYFGILNQIEISEYDEKLNNIFGIASSKYAEITEFYTFGTSLGIQGSISGISKDNFEGFKILVTDGSDYSKLYDADVYFEDDNLYFETEYINDCIDLEDLNVNQYYVLIRLKLNNSKDYKYYLLENDSDYGDIEYYTLTKNDSNNKIDIGFSELEYDGENYYYLGMTVQEAVLPDDVYDFVIDAGHGGTDDGETYSGYTEAELMLEYAEALKTALENKGYKVKLTRDSSNTDSFTYTNMYADDGRITIACESNSKYMISLHLNPTSSTYSGFEIYTPNNCNLDLASSLATNIVNTGIAYSNYTGFMVQDGIYTKNYTENMISETAATAESKGYEPYNITTDTPYLYTIREVGGIATNAYVDGRNTSYDANKYYNSNQGIECYQIFIGYFNNDLEYILNSKEIFANAIATAFDIE